MRINLGRLFIWVTIYIRIRRYGHAVERNGHLLVAYSGDGPPSEHGARCLRCGESVNGHRIMIAYDLVPCPRATWIQLT